MEGLLNFPEKQTQSDSLIVRYGYLASWPWFTWTEPCLVGLWCSVPPLAFLTRNKFFAHAARWTPNTLDFG